MPTAVSKSSNFDSQQQQNPVRSQMTDEGYARTRRPSQTQTSSTTFLPPTSQPHGSQYYSEPQPPESFSDRAAYHEPSTEPDEFYRQYHNSVGEETSRSLHQHALHATTHEAGYGGSRGRQSSIASTQSQDRNVLRSSKSLGGGQRMSQLITTKSSSALGVRKSSFKDLVARFDASPDDVPPIPIFPDAISGSRKTSPVLTMAAQGNTWKHAASAPSARRNNQQSSFPPKKARPLFGEILPGIANSSAGYGILNPRLRRGSEGSPMHSPNPMFGNYEGFDPFKQSQRLPSQSNGNVIIQSSNAPAAHRRATSELSPVMPAGRLLSEDSSLPQQPSHRRGGSSSKIPIRSRQLSIDSGSGTSTPSSRAHSKADNYPISQSSHSRTNLPAPISTARTPRHLKSETRRTPVRGIGQKSRGISAVQGESSPSLRANIIAPPPKISPPLRSSRPRLPVSSATTAASRARIAERFQSMAQEQTDKNSRRARPPELSDIDLKARRLKITQALTKSKEGQELRGEKSASKRTSRSVTPALSEGDRAQDPRSPPRIPALVVEGASFDADDDVFITPAQTPVERSDVDDLNTARTQLHMVSANSHFDDGDSPTLGQINRRSSNLARLEIPLHNSPYDQDEDSALTRGTAETDFDIDDEPVGQAVGPAIPSVYDQIQGIRGSTSTSSPLGVSPSEAQTLDRTDAESVHLIMRDTTYMDEDEAIAKGYRTFMQPPPLPDLYEGSSNGQASWTSSIAEQSDSAAHQVARTPGSDVLEHRTFVEPNQVEEDIGENFAEGEDSRRMTTASDAYSIINIVLQERSSSGIVDQALVDDIYSRIIEDEPDMATVEFADPSRVESLCMQNLERIKYEQESQESPQIPLQTQESPEPESEAEADADSTCDEENAAELRPPPLPKDSLPPSSYRSGHKYKSSLDSVEDWADTSPSIGDWMSYALTRPETGEVRPSPLAQEASEDENEYGTVAILGRSNDPPVPPKDRMPVLPAHSPPPLPVTKLDLTASFPMSSPPEVPDRIASLSQFSSRPATRDSSNVAPSISTQGELSPASKKLKQRRHIMKEIVDTEFTYERDMRVLCDIYKQTATAVLSDEDVKVVFGNIEQIQVFAKGFLTYLKQVVRPVYTMDRKTRGADAHADQESIRSLSPDLNDEEKDKLTQVGVAFEASVNDMSVVYTDYIRSRHVANRRLHILQTDPVVSQWLLECSEGSKDITHAWSLDALSVKPIQRITKYPLLLSSLLDATPPDHPDNADLKRALVAVTEINFRINDIKKQTEIVDQVLSRKRKESDVRNNLTKAFGRRAERLRQHVGVSEVHEDGEFSRLKMEYDNNGVHLLIVSKDLAGYLEAMRGWVSKLTDIAAAAEGWVDVGHSNHPEAESKLRQFGSALRGINMIALPDHIDSVTKKVIQPLEAAMSMVERFKTDPRGLLAKRDKKILDYSVARNKKDRGEKLDRKMTERLEQWEAINAEAKQRMRKLLEATQNLVHSCLQNLVHLHMLWLSMLQQKLSNAMAIDLNKMTDIDLVREWQVDFDYHEATALTLSICNGALLTEAINLVGFLSPSTTYTGDDSPKPPSMASGKRSVSLQSDFSHVPYPSSTRHSSSQHSTQDHPNESASGLNNVRLRATSTASGQPTTSRVSEVHSRTPSSGHGFSRPATSLGQTEAGTIKTTTMTVPRVNLDAPSPSIGPIGPLETPKRPGSTSTFFSARDATGTTNASSHHMAQPSIASTAADTSAGSGTSSIFSSAMPLSDSPATERTSNIMPPGLSPGAGEEPSVLFTAASVYEFNIDRARTEGGIPYLTYVAGEIFDVVGERGELWLARNQDDRTRLVGWIWCKHFAKLAT